ncbi:hypothetical protein D3C84_928430 [compost metagenome]
MAPSVGLSPTSSLMSSFSSRSVSGEGRVALSGNACADNGSFSLIASTAASNLSSMSFWPPTRFRILALRSAYSLPPSVRRMYWSTPRPHSSSRNASNCASVIGPKICGAHSCTTTFARLAE